MADQDQSQATSDSTQSSPSPGMPALPSLNPADSPYKPLDLPQAAPPTQHPMPEQEPIQNLGATNKTGAIAYLVNQALQGATKGYDAARIQHAQQFNKKMTALGALQQQLGQQYKEAYEEVGSSKPDMTPEQILADPKVKQLHNQLLAVHQTTLDAVSKYLPPLQTDPKTGKTKEKRNLMERMFGQQPDESLRAYHEAASKLGPTAFYQVASPQQLQAMYQQRQTLASTSKTAATTADTESAKADINNKLTHAVASGAPQEEIDKLLRQRDELNPSPKFPLAGLKRTGKNADGQWEEWQVDEQGSEIKDTRRPLSTAGLNPTAPKVGSFGDFMVAAYGQKPTPKQYIEGEKLWKQAQGGTTVGTHTVLVTQGDKQVPFTFTTTSTKNFGGGGGTASDVRADGTQAPASASASASAASPTPTTSHTKPSGNNPSAPTHSAGTPRPATGSHAPVQSGEAIGYKDSPEYKGLVKQSIDAQKEYNGAHTNLSTMLKTAPAAKRGDGAAQVGIISAYLKTVVGGAGTGVRITKAEWDAATGTRPFLKGIEAKFSPDGYMTGAAIAPSQVDQMIHEVNAKTKALAETTQAAKQRMLQAQQDQIPTNLKPNASSSSPSSSPSSPSGAFDWKSHPVAQ
jgi:hypothetical protein